MPGPARKFDWPAIKDAYVRGADTKDLAQNFGVSARRVRTVAKKENWERTNALKEAIAEQMIPLGKDCAESRARVLEILEGGGSRGMAAASVGVHRNTLANWAERDPTFEAMMLAAESRSLVDPLKSVQNASRNGTWQAGSWLLERHKLTREDYRLHQEKQAPIAIQINVGGIQREKAQAVEVIEQ